MLPTKLDPVPILIHNGANTPRDNAMQHHIDNLHQLQDLVGQEVGVTPWFTITQTRIDQFAEAIEDRQWIHVDTERAQRESPYGTTVAHGFLTLSLLSFFLAEAVRLPHIRMGINYGLNRVRFPAPVPAGSTVRAHFTLLAFDDLPGGAQLTWHVVVEREGSDKPCCVAEWVTRRYDR
jgi:acyl dehydratase